MPDSSTSSDAEILTPEPAPSERIAEARRIVRQHAMWSMALSMVPLTGLDMALIAGAELHMLSRLSEHYGVRFSENAARAAVATLLGSLGAGALKQSVVGQALKAIPIAGPLLGMMTLPGFGMAFTYAIGRLFIEHFESGGTLLTFNVETARDRFRRDFAAARAGRPFETAPEAA